VTPWKSRAWQTQRSSSASTFAVFSITCAALRAATEPMLTWSSVVSTAIESTLAGKHKVLFSDTSAAAVVLSMKSPMLRSGWGESLSGRPSS